MTVYSINKQVFDQAAMTSAASTKAAATPEQAFAAALQKAHMRFGKGAEVSANTALKERFDRPAAEPRETRSPERPERADHPDRRGESRPAERGEDRAEARPADKAERPAEPRREDRPEAADAAQADEPVADEGAAESADGQAEAQPETADAGTEAPAETQATAAPVQPQQAAAPATVTAPEADLLAEGGDAAADQDPFAWLQKDHGDQIADLESQLDAGAATADEATADVDPLPTQADPAKAVKAATAETQSQVQQKAATAKVGGPETEAVRQQAEDLAERLAGTGADIKVKVSVDQTKAGQSAIDPAAAGEGASLLDDLLAVDAAAEAPVGGQSGNGQPGQSGANNQGIATAAQQLARNGAADNVQAGQGRAAEAKPFAAVLAAQADAGPAQGGQGGAGQTQAVAGLSAATGTQAAHKAAGAQAAQAPHQPRHVEPKQVIDQISVQIAKQAKDGGDTIKVQLKPVDLGRIEIKLEVQDGRVTAHVTADSKDTLAMLQKDARGLEKALQDAGLKTEEGSMTFSLANDGRQAQQGGEAGQRGARRRSRLAAAAANSAPAATAAEAPRTGGRAGVDIKV